MKKAAYIIVSCLFFSFALDNWNINIKPDHFPDLEYDVFQNPLKEDKIELGRKLFYDPILSASHTISCASCHSPYSAFAHTDHDLSHGIHDSIGRRNAPPLFNLAWAKSFNWDGGIVHLDMQALAPINDAAEMGETTANLISKLNQDSTYLELFEDVWKDTISTPTMLKSLSQFLITLVSSNSKYDEMIKGNTEFNQQEENGYLLFKNNCSTCHLEPLFTNGDFANNALDLDITLNDFGKGEVTTISTDSLLFKIPSLRNLNFTYPYMHDGRFDKLRQVVDHYVSIDSVNIKSSSLEKSIVLTSKEKVDLVAFLMTLNDKEFITNKKHHFPRKGRSELKTKFNN
jgi:cytochrome c peroxidase